MFYLKTKSQKIAIALVYLSSHLFLDVFDMGIIPFYPFSIRNVMIDAELGLEIVKDPVTKKIIATNVVSTVSPGTVDYLLPLKSYVQFSNSIEFGVFMLGVSVLIYKLYNKKMRR
jgi:hypothetical protein